MDGLSRLFSLKPWKLRPPWNQTGVPFTILQCTAHLKPFLRNFFVYEKQERYTPGSSNLSFQDLVMDFRRLFYTNHEFENRTFVWVWSIFFSFRWVRFRAIVEFNRTQSNSIHESSSIQIAGLGLIGFDWNLVRLGSIDFAGPKENDLLCEWGIVKPSVL